MLGQRYALINKYDKHHVNRLLKIKEVELPAPISSILNSWGRNFHKIEHIEHGFEEIRIGRNFREIYVYACE